MVEKHIRSRIQLKHALEKDWLKAVNFVPLKGEIIVYDAERVDDDVPEERKVFDNVSIIIDRPRYKIGDGVTPVSDLPFTSEEGVKSVMSVSLGHTEGYETEVLDYGGHAEGLGTIAATAFSHTEGYSVKDYHADSSYLVAGQRGFKIISNTVSNGTTILVLNSVEGIESGDSLSFGVPVKQSALQYAWKPGYIEYEVLSVNQLTNQIVFDGELYYEDETDGEIKPFTVIDGVISELPQILVDYDNRLACSVYFKNKPQIGTLSISCGAHAEGRATRASGDASHAEGRDTEARADYSHAEGLSTIAKGGASHTEGVNTEARGLYSHAEGEGTVAASRAQHVQGKYNVEDSAGVYAHIVGGGTDSTDKKNIHTLDWNGNATYAGDIHACGNIKVGPRGMKPGEMLSTSTFYEMTYSGYVLTNTGTLAYHSSWENDYYTSEYLPIKLCKNVMFKGLVAFTRANIYPVCLYDVSKGCVGAYFPSNDTNTEAHSISVLVNDDFLSSYPSAAYIRVCIKRNYSPVMEYIDGNKQYCYSFNQFSNIACCGDSVTLGRVIEQNQYKDYEIDSQTGLLKHSYPHYLKKMFPLTSITVNAQVGASINNFMSGVYSSGGFGCLDFDWSTYDLIILEFGLNGGADEGAFTTLVNRIREQNSEAKIVFVRNSHSAFMPEFPKIFESLCSNNNDCYWIDLTNTEFGNLDALPYHGKVPGVTPTSGTAQIDYAHFTKRGYLEKAYVVASLIGQKL